MVGVDEVGRGCLAGPLLVVAARAFRSLPGGLKDSKLLSAGQREKLLDLLSNCCNFGEGWVEAAEIDKYGLSGGLRLGVSRALAAVSTKPDEPIILDGKVNYAPNNYLNVSCRVRADSTVPLVSAASIYAKVQRDKLMRGLQSTYPFYGFKNHVGYGTRQHLEALKTYGPIESLHRMTFAPLKQVP